MKTNEDKLLKDLIELEIRQLPNADFTLETINKIGVSKSGKTKSLSFDPLFLSPLFIYTLLFGIFFLIKLFSVATGWHLENLVLFVQTIILSPITISVITSFLLLCYLDFYLRKEAAQTI